jgi:hypothetical protein
LTHEDDVFASVDVCVVWGHAEVSSLSVVALESRFGWVKHWDSPSSREDESSLWACGGIIADFSYKRLTKIRNG